GPAWHAFVRRCHEIGGRPSAVPESDSPARTAGDGTLALRWISSLGGRWATKNRACIRQGERQEPAGFPLRLPSVSDEIWRSVMVSTLLRSVAKRTNRQTKIS